MIKLLTVHLCFMFMASKLVHKRHQVNVGRPTVIPRNTSTCSLSLFLVDKMDAKRKAGVWNYFSTIKKGSKNTTNVTYARRHSSTQEAAPHQEKLEDGVTGIHCVTNKDGNE